MGIGDNDSLKVYVRLPVRIKEELQIKDLHPDIETVRLPRQKSTRWCFIIFKDQETLDRVVTHLKQKKIDGKKIVVKSFARRERKKKVKLSLSTSTNKETSRQQSRLELLVKDEN